MRTFTPKPQISSAWPSRPRPTPGRCRVHRWRAVVVNVDDHNVGVGVSAGGSLPCQRSSHRKSTCRRRRKKQGQDQQRSWASKAQVAARWQRQKGAMGSVGCTDTNIDRRAKSPSVFLGRARRVVGGAGRRRPGLAVTEPAGGTGIASASATWRAADFAAHKRKSRASSALAKPSSGQSTLQTGQRL